MHKTKNRKSKLILNEQLKRLLQGTIYFHL